MKSNFSNIRSNRKWFIRFFSIFLCNDFFSEITKLSIAIEEFLNFITRTLLLSVSQGSAHLIYTFFKLEFNEIFIIIFYRCPFDFFFSWVFFSSFIEFESIWLFQLLIQHPLSSEFLFKFLFLIFLVNISIKEFLW